MSEKKNDFEKLLEEYSDMDFEIHKREKSLKASEQKDLFSMPAGLPDHTLDLHGLLKDEAIRKVETIVKELKVRKITKLRIITGKGKHSHDEPVIPQAVDSLLITLKRSSFIRHIKWENRTVKSSGFVDVV